MSHEEFKVAQERRHIFQQFSATIFGNDTIMLTPYQYGQPDARDLYRLEYILLPDFESFLTIVVPQIGMLSKVVEHIETHSMPHSVVSQKWFFQVRQERSLVTSLGC